MLRGAHWRNHLGQKAVRVIARNAEERRYGLGRNAATIATPGAYGFEALATGNVHHIEVDTRDLCQIGGRADCQRLDEPSTGAGEEVMGATTAAIANAFFDATGVRLRQYPMTPARVKAALAART